MEKQRIERQSLENPFLYAHGWEAIRHTYKADITTGERFTHYLFDMPETGQKFLLERIRLLFNSRDQRVKNGSLWLIITSKPYICNLNTWSAFAGFNLKPYSLLIMNERPKVWIEWPEIPIEPTVIRCVLSGVLYRTAE